MERVKPIHDKGISAQLTHQDNIAEQPASEIFSPVDAVAA
jgi:hypothetical protein